jgi:hypothetical protein
MRARRAPHHDAALAQSAMKKKHFAPGDSPACIKTRMSSQRLPPRAGAQTDDTHCEVGIGLAQRAGVIDAFNIARARASAAHEGTAQRFGSGRNLMRVCPPRVTRAVSAPRAGTKAKSYTV